MIVFAIDKLDHGCVGRPYKNNLEAIKDGAYYVWNEAKIKDGFKFGEATYKDLENHAKLNKQVLLTKEKFYKLLEKLSEGEFRKHERWINESLERWK